MLFLLSQLGLSLNLPITASILRPTTLCRASIVRMGSDYDEAFETARKMKVPEIKAELAKNPSVQFGFEAAVMGGIPIILSLQNDFVGDQITGMQGIMNGCTNFMLTKMAATGCSYQEVLGGG